MARSIYGRVDAVRRFANGDIELDFYHDDTVTQYGYSSDPGRQGGLPKDLAEALATALDTDICIEIFLDDDGAITHIEMEGCDDEEFEEEEYDEDSQEES